MTKKNTTSKAWRLIMLGAPRELKKFGKGQEITTGHYLLALTRLMSTIEVRLLYFLCRNIFQLQRMLQENLLKHGESASMNADQLFSLAMVKAERRGSGKVDLCDILLVLVEVPGPAAEVLASFCVTSDALEGSLALVGGAKPPWA